MTRTREWWSTGTTVTLTLLEDLKAVFLLWSPPCLKPNRCNSQTLRGTPTSWALLHYLISERDLRLLSFIFFIHAFGQGSPTLNSSKRTASVHHRTAIILYTVFTYLSSISVQFEHVHAAYVAVRRYMHMHANPLIDRAPTIIDSFFFVFYSGTVELIIFTVRPACTRLEWLSDDTA